MNNYYENIEKKLLLLIDSLSNVFSVEEVQEITNFIDHGEYGLSIESIVGVIFEENKNIDNIIMEKIIDLYNVMELDSSEVNKLLSKNLL